MHVRFIPVPPRDLPPRLVAASAHIGIDALWKISDDDIDLRDPRFLDRLNAVGTAASQLLTALPRDTRTAPWGRVQIVPGDIAVTDTSWDLTDAGYLIHVPRGLLTETLQAQISGIGTDQLRWFDPPTRDTLRRIMAQSPAVRRGAC